MQPGQALASRVCRQSSEHVRQITVFRGTTMRFSSWVSVGAALCLAIALSQPATAQVSSATTPQVTQSLSYTPVAPGPTLATARLGYSDDLEQPTSVNAAAKRMAKREGRALALVGGAAVIA